MVRTVLRGIFGTRIGTAQVKIYKMWKKLKILKKNAPIPISIYNEN